MDRRHPELRVRLTKRADGDAVLRCERRDGSATWQRQSGRLGAFFPLHDLAHFAVESTLGLRQGFFGLIADGWDIEETGGKGARGPVPPETVWEEFLVGLLDREHLDGGPPLTALELNGILAQLAADGRVSSGPELSDESLAAVRERIAALHDAWAATPEGGTLELAFDRGAGRDATVGSR